jgi:hypothetical protein
MMEAKCLSGNGTILANSIEIIMFLLHVKKRYVFFIRNLLFMFAPCSLSTVLMSVADYYLLVHALEIENL